MRGRLRRDEVRDFPGNIPVGVLSGESLIQRKIGNSPNRFQITKYYGTYKLAVQNSTQYLMTSVALARELPEEDRAKELVSINDHLRAYGCSSSGGHCSHKMKNS